MKISIKFEGLGHTFSAARQRICGTILTTDEADTANWTWDVDGVVLDYRTTKSVQDAIAEWEDDGYILDEFVFIKFDFNL